MAALKQELVKSIAEDTVKAATNAGADETEAYVYQGLSTSVGIERAQISRSSRIVDRGIGIRVVVNKAIGFAYTNAIHYKNAIDDALHKAMQSAKASKPDEDWRGFPDQKNVSPVENVFDKRIVELHSEDLVSFASEMLNAAAETDKRVFPIEGGAGASCLSVAVANSNSVDCFDEGTVVECSLATVGQEGNEVTPVCFEFNGERSLDIDPQWVGREAARLAISALKPKRIETKNMQVIFTQFAMQQLLYFTLINAVKADHVQRNQSIFKDKTGEKVASDIVTIYDDGLLKGGLRTWKFDGEGTPQQRTLIIEKGILRSFLYDNYTARKDGRQSTGNATRAGYLSTPSLEATNFHFMPGNRSAEQLVNEVDEGLLVSYLQGAHSSNPASGEFSIVATPAWKIKKGDRTHATRGIMLAGNIFQLLKGISELADNERKMGQLVAPWMLVENVKVIGK